MRVHLCILAFTGLVLHACGETTSENTTSTGTEEVQTDTLNLSIQGQSGKFTVASAKDPQKKVQVTFRSLHEVDSSGVKTKNGNNVNSFATTDFVFGDLVDTAYNNVNCKSIDFSSQLPTGLLNVTTYLFLEEGDVVNSGPNETQEVYSVGGGSLKFDVTISGFGFCDEASDQTQCKGEIGAALDFQINVKGSQEASQGNGGNKTFELGDGMTIDVSSIINVDSQLTAMESGFPSLEQVGGMSVMTFRFPTFTSSVTYDPVIGGIDGESESDGTDENFNQAPFTPASLLFTGICTLTVMMIQF